MVSTGRRRPIGVFPARSLLLPKNMVGLMGISNEIPSSRDVSRDLPEVPCNRRAKRENFTALWDLREKWRDQVFLKAR